MAPPFFSIFLTFIIFSSFARADVPPSQTFKYINQGEFGEYISEYGADYRLLDIYAFPFHLCFYNTTPNAFTLGLRMGHPRSESLLRWVWAANRNNPVRENATLTFGRDGNLVLADANGRVAWHTNTANKGVVGLKLLNNGNLVLYNAQNQFVWQSFDYPTDTLLVGQALRKPNGPLKIVSRVSDVDGSEGPYSLVLEKNRLALYLKPDNNSKSPLLYYSTDKEFGEISTTLSRVVFNTAPETDEAYAYEIRYELIPRSPSTSGVSTMILGRPKYNSTLSLLRLRSDGNVKVYTYYDKVDWGAWEATYTLFNRDGRVSECRLPSKCGALGVCNEDQCVGCPTPQGLLAWDKATCGVPKRGSCNSKVGYYKVVGVEHFMNWFSEGEGPVKVEECKARCDKDCGCLGYFYREESSKCLLASVLGTLIKVPNPAHVAYIKT